MIKASKFMPGEAAAIEQRALRSPVGAVVHRTPKATIRVNGFYSSLDDEGFKQQPLFFVEAQYNIPDDEREFESYTASGALWYIHLLDHIHGTPESP